VAVNNEKRNTTDFALWKFSPKDSKRAMEWDSPWGKGFPGWHLECSAMSIAKLGLEFDIHAGGIDHIPVHHTNERAQNWGLAGKEIVKWWLHGEFLTIDESRMGKSAGNLITLKTIIDRGIDPLAFRYLALQTHYRQKLTFSWPALEAAQSALTNLREKVSSYGRARVGCAEYDARFAAAVNDDLNTPQALAVVWELIKNRALPGNAKMRSLLQFDRVLGLNLGQATKPTKIPAEIMQLALQRQQLRQKKNWAGADEIRRKIEQRGFSVDDTAAGFNIKKND